MFALARNRLSILSGKTREGERERAKRVRKSGWVYCVSGGCECSKIDVLDLPVATPVTQIVYQYTMHFIVALALRFPFDLFLHPLIFPRRTVLSNPPFIHHPSFPPHSFTSQLSPRTGPLWWPQWRALSLWWWLAASPPTAARQPRSSGWPRPTATPPWSPRPAPTTQWPSAVSTGWSPRRQTMAGTSAVWWSTGHRSPLRASRCS